MFFCGSARPGRRRGSIREKTGQTACKPGSVPPLPKRRRRWPFIWDARRRAPRATYPDGDAETHPRACTRPAAPIRSCSRWGLPCHRRCRRRGALLPHPFTLTLRSLGPGGRFAFCGTFPGVAPAGRYPAPCFRGARTFLPPRVSPLRKAAIRPSGPVNVAAGGGAVKGRSGAGVARSAPLTAPAGTLTTEGPPRHGHSLRPPARYRRRRRRRLPGLRRAGSARRPGP